jgi:hypothetical protein
MKIATFVLIISLLIIIPIDYFNYDLFIEQQYCGIVTDRFIKNDLILVRPLTYKIRNHLTIFFQTYSRTVDVIIYDDLTFNSIKINDKYCNTFSNGYIQTPNKIISLVMLNIFMFICLIVWLAFIIDEYVVD